MNFKIKLLAAFFALVTLSTSTGLHQVARAEDSWSSILKPLVSSVVMPVVNMGLDTMKAKLTQKKAKQEAGSVVSGVQVEALSSAETAMSQMSWKLPEEPSH
jgi:hypothetical protein